MTVLCTILSSKGHKGTATCIGRTPVPAVTQELNFQHDRACGRTFASLKAGNLKGLLAGGLLYSLNAVRASARERGWESTKTSIMRTSVLRDWDLVQRSFILYGSFRVIALALLSWASNPTSPSCRVGITK